MKRKTIILFAVTFVLGVVAGAFARGGRTIDPTLYRGKSKPEAARALLDLARSQAGKGSWENLGVARTYYLGGMKSEGQAIIDDVTSKKAVASDWMRIGEIYYDANEWKKAQDAFDKALSMEPNEAAWLAETGGFYNVKGDRAKAEELFDRAFRAKSDEVWRTVDIAGSYLGLTPHRQ